MDGFQYDQWGQRIPPVDIKEESSESFSLRSPLTISSTLPSSTGKSRAPCSTSRRRAPYSLAGHRRFHPYSRINNERSNSAEVSGIMSNNPAYGAWPQSGARSGSGRSNPNDRRSTDAGRIAHVENSYINYLQQVPGSQGLQIRPVSSSGTTSSLTGAMGDASLSNERHIQSSPAAFSRTYPGNANTNMDWGAQNPSFPAAMGQANMSFSSTLFRPASSPDAQQATSSYQHPAYNAPYTMRPDPILTGAESVGYISSAYRHGESLSPEDSETELRRLRRRVQELETERSPGNQAQNSAGLPTPPNSSSAFQASWKARTDARLKVFCSLNRAGNALCSWHDSRRERRMYPPRNAPPGYLNCGCTYEQALFEASLASHGVGSYLPGDSVRMDPALRNPLLMLLEKRYGYKDGDFEHNPLTGEWLEGESPKDWEQRAQNPSASRRRLEN